MSSIYDELDKQVDELCLTVHEDGYVSCDRECLCTPEQLEKGECDIYPDQWQIRQEIRERADEIAYYVALKLRPDLTMELFHMLLHNPGRPGGQHFSCQCGK